MTASQEVSGHELEDDRNDLLTLECSSFGEVMCIAHLWLELCTWAETMMCSVLQIRSVAVPTVTANISKKKLEFRTLVCLSESSGGPPKLSRETQG